MKYRAEIDGLRALSVVPIILFHANIGMLSGGFIGVDVFFVISGYLITTILMNELQDQRYSIVNFYAKRARHTVKPPRFGPVCKLGFNASALISFEKRRSLLSKKPSKQSTFQE